MNIDRIRASLAESGQFDATDDNGTVYSGEEAAAYYRGQELASYATDLLRRSGVLLPNLQGFHESQDLEFKEALRDIAESLGVTPNVVYNPGCGSHVSLARTFPDARVILVDNFLTTDPSIGDELESYGFELYREDMDTFILPDGLKADITLILNAGHLSEEQLDKVVADRGIVLINDWHYGATYMRENCPNYELVEGVESTQNVYAAEGSRDDTHTLYVFKRIEKNTDTR